MKKRYRVLGVFAVILKVMAILVLIGIWSQWTHLRANLGDLPGLARSIGIEFEGTAAFLQFMDITVAATAIFTGLMYWAIADFIRAHIHIEENTRATVILLRRLVQFQVSADAMMPESINGVWDDGAPPARQPLEKWSKVPITDEMDTVSGDQQNRVYRRQARPQERYQPSEPTVREAPPPLPQDDRGMIAASKQKRFQDK